MSNLKIWSVTFNDGGWHQSLPKFTYVAETDKEAKEMALKESPHYKTWDCWATEFKMEGFVIEVYDELTYKRVKSLEKVVGK